MAAVPLPVLARVCGVSRPGRTVSRRALGVASRGQWRGRLWRATLRVRHARQATPPHLFRGRARRSSLGLPARPHRFRLRHPGPAAFHGRRRFDSSRASCMPVPTDSDALLERLLVREERSLLRAAGTTRVLDTGESTDVAVNPLAEHVFLAAIERNGLAHVHMTDVPRTSVDLGDVGAFGRVQISWSERFAHAAVVTVDGDCIALLAGHRSYCDIVVAGRDPGTVRRVSERLADALRAEPVPDDKVPMRFWSQSSGGGSDLRRAIEVPEWAEIARNYPRAVRPAVDALLAAKQPGGASLILWHGPPGTGKTHAVQALAKAWRSWCSVRCVTDPEGLLRSTPYLMDVVNDPIGDDERDHRLIVLEDAGELMSAPAPPEVGQGPA